MQSSNGTLKFTIDESHISYNHGRNTLIQVSRFKSNSILQSAVREIKIKESTSFFTSWTEFSRKLLSTLQFVWNGANFSECNSSQLVQALSMNMQQNTCSAMPGCVQNCFTCHRESRYYFLVFIHISTRRIWQKKDMNT